MWPSCSLQLVTYGQDTGNPACSHYELVRWSKDYAPVWGHIIPLRLIPCGEAFLHKTAQEVFSNDAQFLSWDELGAEQVADEIAFAVSKRVSKSWCV